MADRRSPGKPPAKRGWFSGVSSISRIASSLVLTAAGGVSRRAGGTWAGAGALLGARLRPFASQAAR
jgi:hypothetical protein